MGGGNLNVIIPLEVLRSRVWAVETQILIEERWVGEWVGRWAGRVCRWVGRSVKRWVGG